MNKFARNLIIILAVLALALFLLIRFIDNYGSAMRQTHHPDQYPENDQ
jgi:hypothetical protein